MADCDQSCGLDVSKAIDVCQKVQSGGTPKQGFSAGGSVPFLKVYNIVEQKVSFDYKPQFVERAVHLSELRKSCALPGDVLMNIVGPPLGKVAIVPGTHPEWNINQAITLFRPGASLSTDWLYLLLCEGSNIRAITHETKGMVGQVNISLSQCRDFVFPLPSIEEQAEIVRRVSQLLDCANEVKMRTESATSHADLLRAAALAKAFRGELVPQDPNDEPASELLARIRDGKVIPKPSNVTKRGRRRS